MILINGVATHALPATDRAVQYGDGVFETIAVFRGEPRAWHRHMRRLFVGCAKLSIPQPDTELLRAEVSRLYKASGNGQERGVLKIIISRGSDGRGYRPPASPSPTRILALYPWPTHTAEWYKLGIRLHVCETPLSCNPALAGIKHLNRLENILAASEWQEQDIAEGLMCDMQGKVIEGTMTNIFAVVDDSLHTPDLRHCGVAGTMRARVIEAAVELGVKVSERSINMEELFTANELFVCNSILNIVGVRQLANHPYVAPGEMTRRLAAVTRDRE